MSARLRTDWDVIEPHYRAGLRSLADMGAEFGVSDAAIIKHAKRHGWDRNLKAKIQAKADAKVSAAMVSAEVSETKTLTEALRIDVESEVQARIRLAHRKDIGAYRVLSMQMLAELEAAVDEKLGLRAKIMKDLTDVTKTLIGLESDAFGLAAAPAPTSSEEYDPEDLARRMAFVFAEAKQSRAQSLVH